jgi:hypothetical protein
MTGIRQPTHTGNHNMQIIHNNQVSEVRPHLHLQPASNNILRVERKRREDMRHRLMTLALVATPP